MGLKLAVEAGLPLISITTRDTLSFQDVVNAIVGKKPTKLPINVNKEGIKADRLYYMDNFDPKKVDINKLYRGLVDKESSLLCVNPKTHHELVHHVGVLPVPKEYIVKILGSFFDKDVIENVLPCFGGLTMHEIGEVIRLTQARDGDLTPKGINLTRKMTVQTSQGLSLIDTHMIGYEPFKLLEDYTTKNKDFFLHEQDFRLIPRGLMFDGPPGTGKTQGAKYMANKWGVPLFRLDGTVQSKYVGESENNLANALSQLDNEEPCILLIDEVEKWFNKNINDSSGVNTRIMSQLLWWLQEHRSRVFTILTCNNNKIIPPELFREGRVDETLVFPKLDKKQGIGFAQRLAKTFDTPIPNEVIEEAVSDYYKKSDDGYYSHAVVSQFLFNFVKYLKLEAQKG